MSIYMPFQNVFYIFMCIMVLGNQLTHVELGVKRVMKQGYFAYIPLMFLVMTVPTDSVWWSIFWWVGHVGKYWLYSRACKTCWGMKAKLSHNTSYTFYNMKCDSSAPVTTYGMHVFFPFWFSSLLTFVCCCQVALKVTCQSMHRFIYLNVDKLFF